MNLAGRGLLVTGAGSGLGRAHALLLARLGASVVVSDLPGTPSTADAVAAQIQQPAGPPSGGLPAPAADRW